MSLGKIVDSMTCDVTGIFKGYLDFWSIIFKVGQNNLQIMPSSQRCLIQVQMSLGKIGDSTTGDVTGIFKVCLVFWSIIFKEGQNNLLIMPSSRGFNLDADVTGKIQWKDRCLYFWSIIFKVRAVQMVKQCTNQTKFREVNLAANVTGKNTGKTCDIVTSKQHFIGYPNIQ